MLKLFSAYNEPPSSAFFAHNTKHVKRETKKRNGTYKKLLLRDLSVCIGEFKKRKLQKYIYGMAVHTEHKRLTNASMIYIVHG